MCVSLRYTIPYLVRPFLPLLRHVLGRRDFFVDPCGTHLLNAQWVGVSNAGLLNVHMRHSSSSALTEGLSPHVEDIIYTTRACIHSCTGARQYGHFGIFAEHASRTLWWPHGTAMCDLGPVMHTMNVV
mgnify:FL=1|jgi:hypothetical protein